MLLFFLSESCEDFLFDLYWDVSGLCPYSYVFILSALKMHSAQLLLTDVLNKVQNDNKYNTQ